MSSRVDTSMFVLNTGGMPGNHGDGVTLLASAEGDGVMILDGVLAVFFMNNVIILFQYIILSLFYLLLATDTIFKIIYPFQLTPKFL